MKFLKIFIPTVVLFIGIYLFAMFKMMNYESFYSPSDGEFYSFESFKNQEAIPFILYKFVLNFPLSVFNWFTNKYLFTTTYFFIPNSIVLTLLVMKRKTILSYLKTRINK